MNRRQIKRIKKISQAQEKRAANELGGKTMAASGATRLGGGGDVRVMSKTRLECKFTENDSYRLCYSDLRKVRKQAFKALESPVLQFAFYCNGRKKHAYAVIPWNKDENSELLTEVIGPVAATSYSVTEGQLNSILQSRRIKLLFLNPQNEPLSFRVFEIMSWQEYVDKYIRDPQILINIDPTLTFKEGSDGIRNKYDSGLHGASDSAKGRDPKSD